MIGLALITPEAPEAVLPVTTEAIYPAEATDAAEATDTAQTSYLPLKP